eukprot:TRINITY_DN10585_c0_g1_i1.p4 TRINITY_DN10585_c0_g1~~TRINITY_DN10585_c0_g1_i1.p4  ORF type:complete len:116 (+),score=55.72 TRINITY_DN10585_c0_g1_i1:56-403(+)
MGRGSIKHDHSKLGLIPGQGRLDKNRKSVNKAKKLDKLQQTATSVDEAVTRIQNEGQLVPLKAGKLIKAEDRPQKTPPPHKSFRKSTSRKLSQGKMRVVVRQMMKKKKEAAEKSS